MSISVTFTNNSKKSEKIISLKIQARRHQAFNINEKHIRNKFHDKMMIKSLLIN